MRYLFVHILLLMLMITPNANALESDASKAVILAYFRVGEPQNPESNITTELFDSHLEEILESGYTVLPLTKIVTALRNKKPLPPKTIAITFEGGYRSAYENAIPKLIENEIPFTVFIASENTKIPSHLDWKTLKKIAKFEGAEFGILPSQYGHITGFSDAQATRLINKSRITFKKKMKKEVSLFSYPYGEISNNLIEIAEKQGFTAAFGLHSGPAHSGSNMLALPRFTMTSHYADIDRFQMITNTLPLPVDEIEPADWKRNAQLTQIGFTAPQSIEHELQDLSCHISDQENPKVEIIANRVEIIPQEPITHERSRINCTLATTNENDEKQWRWLGMMFHMPSLY